MGDEFESTRRVSRNEAATVLQRLAAGVGAGTVALGDDGFPVEIPTEVELELEVETEDGERSLEAELAWAAEAVEDGASADGERGEAESGDGERRDETSPTDEPVAANDGAVDAGDDETSGEAIPVSVPDASQASFEVYRDRASEWRWRLRHRNGNVIADSGEGYDRKRGAVNGLESVRANAPLAGVVEQSNE